MSTLLLELNSQNHWLADGSQTIWNFSFAGGYINRTHVKAYTKTPSDVRTELIVTDDMFLGDFQLYITPAVANGDTLVIYRDTPKEAPLVDFADGANINEISLDTNAKQAVFSAAEASDFFGATTSGDLVALAQQASTSEAAASASASNSSAFATTAAISASAAAASASAAATSAAAASTAVTALSADLANPAVNTKGAGLIGFVSSLVYAANTVGSFLRSLTLSGGAALLGWIQAGTGAVQRSLQDRLRDRVSVKDFGAIGNGVTDDTAAFIAALTYLFNIGGGTLFIPAGNYSVSSIVFNWTAGISINWQGAGALCTILTKRAGTTTPVLDLSVDIGVLDIYSSFNDFSIVGNAKTNHGFRATRLASCSTRNLYIRACDVAFENVGALVWTHHSPFWLSNNIGMRLRKSSTIYANLISIIGGAIKANSSFGIDIGEGSGFHTYGVDIELNGTSSNLSTGGMVIRSTVSAETGVANISLNNGWFEANLGQTLKVEASALNLNISNMLMLSSEAGKVIDCAAISSIELDGVIAAGASDTVVLAAGSSTIRNSTIHTLTDTSTDRVVTNSLINAGANLPLRTTTAEVTGTLTMGAGSKIVSPGAFSSNAALVTFADGQSAGNQINFYQTNGAGANAAASCVRLGASSTTGRSLNAGGTLNAGGADYAEYMEKAADCGVIRKGDIVGINKEGKLTDRFSHAISFAVKSTNPGLVGNDSWFDGKDFDSTRNMVDRVAFCGQVPVNIHSAQVGAYIVPVQASCDRITGTVVVAPDFEEYKRAVGKIVRIDGQGAHVIVKIN